MVGDDEYLTATSVPSEVDRKIMVLGFSCSEAGSGEPTCSRKSRRLSRRSDRARSCCSSGKPAAAKLRSKEPLDLMKDMVLVITKDLFEIKS
jgi:hypothetical protein